jgi:hypothetical protein
MKQTAGQTRNAGRNGLVSIGVCSEDWLCILWLSHPSFELQVHSDEEVKALFKQVQGEVPGSPIFVMKVASQVSIHTYWVTSHCLYCLYGFVCYFLVASWMLKVHERRWCMSKQSYERDFFRSFSLVIAACGSFMSRCF